MINLPLPVDPNTPDNANLEIIQAEEVKLVAKRQQKLEEALKKASLQYTTNAHKKCETS
jgi:hypothetical protein